MHKRGQVAVFVVIGIVIVILVALLFVGRNQYGLGIDSTLFLNNKLEPIQEDVESCVDQSSDKVVRLFMHQGGDINPSRNVLYENKKVKYFCYDTANSEKCVNMMPPLNVMVSGLGEELDKSIKNCVNKDLVRGGLGYEVNVNSEPDSELKLEGNDLRVVVDYDVEIVKDASVNRLGKIEKSLDVPLIDLYNVAYDIVNSHASEGFFEQVFYMLDKKGKYIIDVDKSPSLGNPEDRIYKLNKTDEDYSFWFAIEG